MAAPGVQAVGAAIDQLDVTVSGRYVSDGDGLEDTFFRVAHHRAAYPTRSGSSTVFRRLLDPHSHAN